MRYKIFSVRERQIKFLNVAEMKGFNLFHVNTRKGSMIGNLGTIINYRTG